MIKKSLSAFLMIVVLSLTSSAQRIAIVDINEVLASYPDYKSAEGLIDKVASEWKQDIAQEYDKIKAMYNKYQAEQILLNEDQKKQREENKESWIL